MLSFAAPYALLLIPIAVVLAFWAAHRAERRPRLQTSFPLFALAASRLGQVAPKRRSVPKASLLLSAATALALALSEPHWTRSVDAPVVLVLDRSASMASESSAGVPRLLAAKAFLEAERISPARVLALPEVLPGEDPFQPTQAEVPMAAIQSLCDGLSRSLQSVILVTDQHSDLALPAGVSVLRVPAARLNAGITAAGLSEEGELLIKVAADEALPSVRVRVAREGGPPVNREVAFLGGRARVLLKKAELPPGEGALLVALEHPGSADGRDGNSIDDHVRLVTDRSKLLVLARQDGPRGAERTDDLLLLRALGAHPDVQIVAGEPSAALKLGTGSQQVEARMLTFADLPPDWGEATVLQGALGGPGLSLGVAGEELRFLRALRPPPGLANASWLNIDGEPLLIEVLSEADRNALSAQSARLFLWLAELGGAAWPDRPSFPLAVANFIDRAFTGGGEAFGARAYAAGERLALSAAPMELTTALGGRLHIDRGGIFCPYVDATLRNPTTGEVQAISVAPLSLAETLESGLRGALPRAAMDWQRAAPKASDSSSDLSSIFAVLAVLCLGLKLWRLILQKKSMGRPTAPAQ